MRAQILALLTSIFYATTLVSARRGLRYSTPITVTSVSVLTQNALLWGGVFLTGGIPKVAPTALWLFVLVGVTQFCVRMFSYSGVEKIGASRSSALQSVSPIVSTLVSVVRPSVSVTRACTLRLSVAGLMSGAGADFFSGLTSDDRFGSFFENLPLAVNAVNPLKVILGRTGLYESADGSRGAHITQLHFFRVSDASVTRIDALAYGGRSGGVGNPNVVFAGIRLGSTGTAFSCLGSSG